MEDIKTESGLTIVRMVTNDGGFHVRLTKPNGEPYTEIYFDEDWDEWQWRGAHSSSLNYLIDEADAAYAKQRHEEEKEKKRQQEARKAKSVAMEPHWQAVVDKYADKYKK